MTEYPYCGNCENLSITEEQQDKIKKYNNSHKCLVFKKRVKHAGQHPHLPRLPECIEQYGLESMP